MPVDLEKIQDSPHLLDLLLQMEDVLDSLDIYVFRNWFKGEIVEGPSIRRYWLGLTLKYEYDEMPDPRAGLRLLKHDIRVEYQKARQEKTGIVPVDDGGDEPVRSEASGDDEETSEVWLVHISMPRRLVSQIATSEMDFYDDDIDPDDVEDVEDAKDSGADDEESGYETPEPGAEDEGEGGEGVGGDEDEAFGGGGGAGNAGP